MKVKDINSMTNEQLAEYYFQLNLVLHPDSHQIITKTICKILDKASRDSVLSELISDMDNKLNSR